MKVASSTTIRASAYGNSTEALRKALAAVPKDSEYDLHYSAGDRPWDSDEFTITFTWDEEL